MNKAVLLATIPLAAVMAVAQVSSTDSSATMGNQTSSAQAGDASSENTTVQGCLSGSSGNYTLTDMSGKSWQLQGNTSQLSSNIGHEVAITGSYGAGSEASESAAGTGESAATQNNSSDTLTITGVRSIADTCGNVGATTSTTGGMAGTSAASTALPPAPPQPTTAAGASPVGNQTGQTSIETPPVTSETQANSTAPPAENSAQPTTAEAYPGPVTSSTQQSGTASSETANNATAPQGAASAPPSQPAGPEEMSSKEWHKQARDLMWSAKLTPPTVVNTGTAAGTETYTPSFPVVSSGPVASNKAENQTAQNVAPPPPAPAPAPAPPMAQAAPPPPPSTPPPAPEAAAPPPPPPSGSEMAQNNAPAPPSSQAAESTNQTKQKTLPATGSELPLLSVLGMGSLAGGLFARWKKKRV